MDLPNQFKANSSTPRSNLLTPNSFLSLDSAAPSPVSPQEPQGGALDNSSYFPSAAELLEHVTRNWRQNFVTQDLRTEQIIEMFIKRPFFMLISIDGPLSDRLLRANKFVLYPSYNRLHHALLRRSRQTGLSLDAFIIANDADVYGRRRDATRRDDMIENGQVEYLSPLHVLQKYVTLHVVNNFDTVTALHSYLDEINLLDADRLRPSWDSYFMVRFA